MAYSELIKNFNRIRAYMRAFYVYGFRHRGEYDQKSARGYDDERRRVESWLGEYMVFRQDAKGRRFFLSVDSRAIAHNPLYRAFRARSFTDRDIMLHFHLMDILAVSGPLPIFDIMEALTARLNTFEDVDYPDESTVRRKLSECVELGLIVREKRGRETRYRRAEDRVCLETWQEALDFFSEAAPLGVIGDFCRDKVGERPSLFRFKHHYILNALDSEVLCALADAIGQRRVVQLTMGRRRISVAPMKLYISTQTGRQYVLAWASWREGFSFYRIDAIDAVRPGDAAQLPGDIEARLADFASHAWGASGGGKRVHIEMTVYVGEGEAHIPCRLEREKRCGQVEQVDEHHWRFTAEVWDALELMPWIRTFIGRITDLRCDDPEIVRRFREDMAAMAEMYGGGSDAVS